MSNLPYSIVIEATDDPEFFGFYSPELEGFSGVGHSIEDCLYKARHGLDDHVRTFEGTGTSRPADQSGPESHGSKRTEATRGVVAINSVSSPRR